MSGLGPTTTQPQKALQTYGINPFTVDNLFTNRPLDSGYPSSIGSISPWEKSNSSKPGLFSTTINISVEDHGAFIQTTPRMIRGRQFRSPNENQHFGSSNSPAPNLFPTNESQETARAYIRATLTIANRFLRQREGGAGEQGSIDLGDRRSFHDLHRSNDTIAAYNLYRSSELDVLRESRSIRRSTDLSVIERTYTPSPSDIAFRHTISKNIRYKTKLCTHYENYGCCPADRFCQFAHGPADLRVACNHPKFRTQPCVNFTNRSFCPYGDACYFRHTRIGYWRSPASF